MFAIRDFQVEAIHSLVHNMTMRHSMRQRPLCFGSDRRRCQRHCGLVRSERPPSYILLTTPSAWCGAINKILRLLPCAVEHRSSQ